MVLHGGKGGFRKTIKAPTNKLKEYIRSKRKCAKVCKGWVKVSKVDAPLL